MKLTIGKVKRNVRSKSNGRWIVLSNTYINNRTPLKMKYAPENKNYKVSYENFMRSKRWWNKGYRTRKYAKKLYEKTNHKWKLYKCTYKKTSKPIKIIRTSGRYKGRVRRITPKYITSIHYHIQPINKMSIKTSDMAIKIWTMTKHQWELDSEYKNEDTRIRVKHIRCGHTRTVMIRSLRNNGWHLRCYYCHNRGIFKPSSYYRNILIKLGILKNYKFVGIFHHKSKYGYKTYMVLNHDKCGHYFVVSMSHIKRKHKGYLCPFCGHICHNNREFQIECYDNFGCKCIAGTYKGFKSPTLLHCNECGKTSIRKRPYLLVHTNYKYTPCRHCLKMLDIKQNRISESEIKKLVRKITHNEYQIVGHTRGTHHKAKFLHKVCGHTFIMTPKTFFSGIRCPYCAQSHGEKVCQYWMENLKLISGKDFIHAYRLHNAKSSKRLHLDFYLPHLKPIINGIKYYNGVGIEYDGQQHFEPVNWTGNLPFIVQFFNLCWRHHLDIKKDKYCKKHHIYLIRICGKNGSHIKQVKRLVNKKLNQKLLPLLK